MADLIAKLQGPTAEDRAGAARLLGEMGEEAAPAISSLIDLLKDNRQVREGGSVADVASESLVKMGRPAAEACLLELKKDGSWEDHERIRITIGEFQDQDSIELLITQMETAPTSTVTALRRSTDPRLVPSLLTCFQNTDGSFVSRMAIEHFKRHTDSRAVEPLISALESEDETTREHAVQAIGRQRDRRAIPSLLDRMHDQEEDSNIQRASAEALGRIGGPDAFKILTTIVERKDDLSVPRPGATQSLDHTGNPVSSDIWGLRLGAVQGLGHLGDRRASETLESLVCNREQHDVIRNAAAKSLVQIEGKGAFSIMKKIATDASESARVRFHVAVDLVEAADGAIDDTGIVAALTCWGYSTYPISEAANVRAAIVAFKAIVNGDNSEQVRSAAKQHLLEATKRAAQLKGY